MEKQDLIFINGFFLKGHNQSHKVRIGIRKEVNGFFDTER
jgi:hypothetical protein